MKKTIVLSFLFLCTVLVLNAVSCKKEIAHNSSEQLTESETDAQAETAEEIKNTDALESENKNAPETETVAEDEIRIPEEKNVDYIELGIPTAERYVEGITARCPWDMEIFDGKIYVGSGDYGENSGPVDIWAYDTEEKKWLNTGEVPDEEVDSFLMIDGCLTVPGTDPKDGWEYGNYYKLIDGNWEVIRTIPGGVHNFGMAEFDGKIFAALGVVAGNYPIAYSTDGGETFYEAELLKDGESVDTSDWNLVRAEGFVVLENTLYAFVFGKGDGLYNVYKYADGKFVFDDIDLSELKNIRYCNKHTTAWQNVGDGLFISFGLLYYTEDMKNFSLVETEEGEVVYDLYKYDGKLYALCGKELENGSVKTTVRVKDDESKVGFYKVFSFVYDIPPLSFVYNGDDFYIGMGKNNTVSDKNGMILQVDIQK